MTELFDRIPPQSIEMEQATLGAMLSDRFFAERIATKLDASEFYRPAHQCIFTAIGDLVRKDEPVDLLTVQEQLRFREQLDLIGSSAYLIQLTQSLPTVSGADYYAGIVRQKAYLRRVLETAAHLEMLAHSEYDDFEDIRSAVDGMLYDLAKREDAVTASDIRSILDTVWEEMEERAENPGRLMGISTGFNKLDFITGGIRPGNLVIVGARPGIGKSALGINIACHVAQKFGTVAFFSLEMSKEEQVQRALCCQAKINTRLARTGNLEGQDWKRAGIACAVLNEYPLYIFDRSESTVPTMKADARGIDRGNVSLVLVDYLQLAKSHKKTDNRTQEVGQISRALKAMARDLKCPVIAMAQLNRAITEKKPTMANLRESGDIEADADMIWLLYNPDQKETEQPDFNPHDEEDENPEIAVDLLIEKHRNGARGTVPLWFQRQFSRFESRTEYHHA